MSKFNIVITGGIASGKSTVAKIFHDKFNIPIIDSDHIAKNIVNTKEDLKEQIINKFGDKIITEHKLDRRKLREIIFSDKNSKTWLEQLLHPQINHELRIQALSLAQTNKYPYCLLLIPLVTEEYIKNNDFIDKIIVVSINQKQQIARASSRDQQTPEEIQKIIDHQLSDSQRLKLADYVISNNTSMDDLISEVERVHNLIIQDIT